MKINKKKVNVSDYILFNRMGDTAAIDIVAPATYSNSGYFNLFDYNKEFAGLSSLSVKIDSKLIFDSFLYIMVEQLKQYCKMNSIHLVVVSENEFFDSYQSYLASHKPGKLRKEKKNIFTAFFEGLGNSAKTVCSDLLKFVEFIGDVAIHIVTLPKNFSQVRWTELPNFLIRVGVNSIGICLLIVFLIGIIIGYVGALQLSRFGVGSFLASLVGIAVTRELSPLMVGIIIAGRTGSAFTAEIGTMRVSDEVDALTSFGFDKQYFLVFPRLIATIISLPLMVSICNIAGIIGGYFAGNAVLNINFAEFQMELLDSSLSYADVLGGIFKSFIFGGIIAVVGCFKGFQVSGGAESVGRYTTSSVVTSIFLIVLVDAVFAFLL
ncbi:MAG: ABC transporter permease [Ignavibacteria bacterium]|jgi:phospholipid/cholesterol/gamma-HCH transport system permease protein|nr:ABC transporter permease [Ignavibacteria bacterium]